MSLTFLVSNRHLSIMDQASRVHPFCFSTTKWLVWPYSGRSLSYSITVLSCLHGRPNDFGQNFDTKVSKKQMYSESDGGWMKFRLSSHSIRTLVFADGVREADVDAGLGGAHAGRREVRGRVTSPILNGFRLACAALLSSLFLFADRIPVRKERYAKCC